MHIRPPARFRDRASRGQSLVEFALVLPILLLLMLIALDFGRVYLGWINLQNMTRIAANYAANAPDAWDATPDTTVQTRYRNQVLADAAATNCRLPQSGGNPVVPPPTFTDVNSNGIGLGDTVQVQITCTFDVITPLISNILGGTVAVSAESNFPVKSGLTATGGGGGGGGSGSAATAAFSANGAISPDPISGVGPFDVEFRDTSGGSPNAWRWDFGDGSPIVTVQDPLIHTFTCATASCTYTVEMEATNAVGSSTATMAVTVLGATDVNFTSNTQSGNRPLTVQFADASTPGGTTYAWTFGDGTTGSGTTATKTYNVAGTYDVSLTVTYPSPIGPKTTTKVGYITVSPGLCTVPSLFNVRVNSAEGIWQGSPNNFTGTVIRGAGTPSGNFQIKSQDLTATSVVPCNSSVTVYAVSTP